VTAPLELSADAPQWAYFATVSAGSARVHGERSEHVSAGIGAEATVVPLRYHRPRGESMGFFDVAELHTGVWALGWTRAHGGDLEGGFTFQLGNVYHPNWGLLELRAGAGYGTYDTVRASHATISFAYGMRWARLRWRPPDRSVLRFVTTFRPALGAAAGAYEIAFAVEISPTLFL
jgi:hypothetical protein